LARLILVSNRRISPVSPLDGGIGKWTEVLSGVLGAGLATYAADAV